MNTPFPEQELAKAFRWLEASAGCREDALLCNLYNDTAILTVGDVRKLAAALSRARAEAMEEAAQIANNPGFIQGRDTEWDEGVNYAKQFTANLLHLRARALSQSPRTESEVRRNEVPAADAGPVDIAQPRSESGSAGAPRAMREALEKIADPLTLELPGYVGTERALKIITTMQSIARSALHSPRPKEE